MVQVPPFILKRLYVRGSLHAVETGFSFDVVNQLGVGYAWEMLPVTLDGVPQPLAQTYFRQPDGTQIAFSDVSEALPFTLEMGGHLTIGVEGVTVTPGPHKVGMGFVVRGIGPLSFEVNEIVT